MGSDVIRTAQGDTIEVIKKGSEIRVNDETYVSMYRIEQNPVYYARMVKDLVESGKIRTYPMHAMLYYNLPDLDKAFPVGFTQSK